MTIAIIAICNLIQALFFWRAIALLTQRMSVLDAKVTKSTAPSEDRA